MSTALTCQVCGREVCRLVNADPVAVEALNVHIVCMACARVSRRADQ